MVAQSWGTASVEALCLSGDGPLNGKYTTGRMTCAAWKSGHLGAVDQPPDYGEAVRAAYAAEEAAGTDAPCLRNILASLSVPAVDDGGKAQC